jgi:hypothetical protein
MKITIALLFFAFSLSGQIVIKTESDIKKIQLGDSYIIDGPVDPIEFFEFLLEIEPKIDAHIERLLRLIKNPVFSEIEECLKEHTLSTNKKFLVADLRAFGIEILRLSETEVEIKEPQLIKLLQSKYE